MRLRPSGTDQVRVVPLRLIVGRASCPARMGSAGPAAGIQARPRPWARCMTPKMPVIAQPLAGRVGSSLSAASDCSSRVSSGISAAFSSLAAFSYIGTRQALPRRLLVAS